MSQPPLHEVPHILPPVSGFWEPDDRSTSRDPAPGWAADRLPSDRVRRLAAVLLARRARPEFERCHRGEGRLRAAAEVAERYADGLAGADELRRCRGALGAVDARFGVGTEAVEAARAAAADDADLPAALAEAAEGVVGVLLYILEDATSYRDPRYDAKMYAREPALEAEKDAQCRLLGLFVPLGGWDDRWRTTDAAGLARYVYDEGAFDLLPVLADALQDAGCDHPWLLDFLRHPHASVCCGRGVWFLDRLRDEG